MADIQSNINVNIDTSSALASIKLLQAQMSAFHTSMAKGTATSANAASQLQQKLIDSVNATRQFSAGIQTIKTTTESFTSSLEKNKLSLGQYFKYSIAATKSFGGAFKTEMSTIDKVARERVKDLQTQYIKLGRDANGAMKAIAIRPLALDLDNLQTKTALAAQKQQILNQLLKQGSTNLLNFGKNTQWAGRQLMVGFTIPLSMAGTAAAKAYMDIEKASIQIQRVYGDLSTTAQETNNMVSQIKNLAAEYTKYGVAIADTMSMAAKAAAMGKTGAELLAQVNNATKLSVLGGVDQEQALETTISLTNAFGISADQLSSKINFLNAVENQTVTSIEDLTIAIPKAGPVIKQLGGNVEDLAFFLTAMKEGGINASEGANALKSGLAALINPTGKAADMLASYGINVNKIVTSNKGDVKKTVIDFAKALDTLDPLTRSRAIEQMFGKFQFARISTLFQNVVKEGSQASKALGLANTSAIQLAAMSRRELDKLESSPMYKFQKSIADLQLKIAPIGETFLKAVTPIISMVSDFLGGFNKMGDGFKQFVVVGAAVLGGLAPILLMVTGLVANGAANIIKLFANVKAFLNKTTSSSQILGETTNYLTTEQIKAESVAASLDQIHSKLSQTFTVEAGAATNLVNIYSRMNAEMNRFSVPGIPTTLGKGKKMAAGGIIHGPGTGTSDSIVAMVSNGEAIIPAKSVARNPNLVNLLVSGKVPGFAGGKYGYSQASTSGIIAAHGVDKKTLNPQESVDFAMKNLVEGTRAFKNFTDTTIQRDRNVYSNLVLGMPGKFNTGQMSGTESSNWIKEQPEAFGSYLKSLYNIDPKSPGMLEFGQNLADILAKSGSKAIDDPAFYAAVEAAITKTKNQEVQKLLRQASSDYNSGEIFSTNGKERREALAGAGPSYIRRRNPIRREFNAIADQYSVKNFNDSAKATAQTASESKRTKKIAKDTVDGFANELQRGKKKILEAGDGVTAAAVQSATRTPRRASQAQTNYDLLNLPMQGPARPTRLQSLQSKVVGLGNKTVGDLSTGKLAGLGAAVSMATFALAGMPGPIGQVAGAILPMVSIFSVVSPLLTTFGASLGIASLPLLPVAAGLAAVAAVVGVAAFLIGQANDARKKELEQINASSQAYKYAKDSVSAFAEAAGVKKKSTVSDFAAQSFSTKATAGQMDDVQTLLASDAFNNKDSSIFKMIENLKKMTNVQAKAFIQAYGQTLIASGIGKESVDAEIKAIQAAAGKAKLNLTFDSIDLTSKNAQKDLLKSFNNLDKNFAGISPETAGFTRSGERSTKDLEKYRNAYKTFSDQASNSLKAISDQFTQGIIDGKTYDRMMNGITSRIGAMTDKATQARVIKRMFSELSPETRAFANSIGDANQQLKIYQVLLLGGAEAMAEMQNEIARARSSGGTQEQIKGWVDDIIKNISIKYGKIAKALNDAISKTVGATGVSKSVSKDTIKTLADFITSITKANTSIGYQATAFTRLTAAGISAANALKLIQDADLARIIATEGDVKKRKQLIDLLAEQIDLENKLKETTTPEQSAIDKGNKKIAVLEIQNKISQLGLDRISNQEDVINKAYDKRLEALDNIQQANKDIAAQQQDQLDLSSALAKGDMAAASRAAQKLRATAAEKAMTSQKTALENSRKAEIAGLRTTVGGVSMSRDQIENTMAARNDQINTIQTNEVAPNELKLAETEAPITTPVATPVAPVSLPKTNNEAMAFLKIKNSALYKKVVADIATITKYTAILNSKTATAAMKASSKTKIDIATKEKTAILNNAKIGKYANGGLVSPMYLANGGYASGTDIVPAMLTPGEFIVKKSAVDNFGANNLKSINNGSYSGDSVYNYSINVNAGTNASTDDIARAVMAKIKQVDSQRIRGNTF